MRATLVICCIASAGIHLALVPEHLREMPPLGVSFAVAASVLIVAAGTTAAKVRGAELATTWLMISLVAAYAIVLPFEDEPVTALALTTKAIELVGVAAGLSLLRGNARAIHALSAATSAAAQSASLRRRSRSLAR